MSRLTRSVTLGLCMALAGCNGSSRDKDATDGSSRPYPASGAATGAFSAGSGASGSSAGNGGQTGAVDFPVYIDPTSPEFIESNPSHFGPALTGSWMSSDCTAYDGGYLEYQTSRAITVFTETELIRNVYSYTSSDCSGIPFGEWYPVPVFGWSLGNYIQLEDGSHAWELDTVAIQRGLFRNEVGDEVGETQFDIVSFVNGQLEFGISAASTRQNRPLVRSGSYHEIRPERGLMNINSAALQGTWFSHCTGRLESTYEFLPDILVVTDENWADVGCEGESYASRRTTFSIDYGDAFISRQSDTLLAITLNAVSNELLKYDASQGLDEPEFKVPEGKTEYRAVSIDEENTLILGYCLYRNQGDDNCQDSSDRIPDMVDYNWNVRFLKR